MKKLFVILMVSGLLFSLIGCQKEDSLKVQERFDLFVKEDFKETVEDDYLTYHVRFEQPERYGLEKEEVEVSLGEVYDEETYQEIRDEVKELKEELHSFPYEQLSDVQRDIYDQMNFDLAIYEKLYQEKFDYMYSYFPTINGTHNVQMSLFADFLMRDEEDVKDYIKLLRSYEEYVDDVLVYTKKQAELGLLHINFEEVLGDIENSLDIGMESSILVKNFESIDALDLAEETSNCYKEEITKVFKESYLVALNKMYSCLKGLEGFTNNTQGLANLPNGKEYYEIRYQQKMGFHRTLEKTRELLEQYYLDALIQYFDLLEIKPELFDEYVNAKTSYQNYEEMLEDLDVLIQNDFPSFGDIEYTIGNVSEDLAVSGIAAYFNIPALDSIRPREIYVNASDEEAVSSIHTFLTIAHEGIPGHMYQFDHYYRSQVSDWLKLQGNDGFVEGYATYVELVAADYLKEQVGEDVIELMKAETVVLNCIVQLFDIAIHYDGLSKEEAMDYVRSLGIEPTDELYAQIQANPLAFAPYYSGYIEIMELRKMAEDALGDRFDLKEFHNALLKSGGLCFDVIEKDVKEYIEAK